MSRYTHTFRRPSAGGAGAGVRDRMMRQADVSPDETAAPVRRRALSFSGWIVCFLALTFAVGMLPTIFLFALAFMKTEGERWPLSIAISACLVVFCWFVFDELLALPWPDSLLGALAPALKEMVPGI